jgi:hypothetical protein
MPLANLIQQRNIIDGEIAALIDRPPHSDPGGSSRATSPIAAAERVASIFPTRNSVLRVAGMGSNPGIRRIVDGFCDADAQ